MVTIDDVAKAVGDQLTATTAFTAACPGGVWNGRAADTPTGYPYATFTVMTNPPSLCLDDCYVQAFEVRLAAYCPDGLVGVDPQAVQTALFTSLCTETAMAAMQGRSLRNASERIMHSIPMPATAEFSPTLREARDVFIAGLQVEILVQGDRSLS